MMMTYALMAFYLSCTIAAAFYANKEYEREQAEEQSSKHQK